MYSSPGARLDAHIETILRKKHKSLFNPAFIESYKQRTYRLDQYKTAIEEYLVEDGKVRAAGVDFVSYRFKTDKN